MEQSIAVIPARGGSKSIPKKNIVSFCGKPLIAHSIEIAKKCPSIARVIVDTDSEEIALVSKKYGAEVLYIRPEELAQDNTPDLPVFQYALNFLQKNNQLPEFVIHLRPTSPYRTVEKIEEAIRIIKNDEKITCVRGVTIPDQNPFKMWTIRSDGFLKPLIESEIKEAYNQPRQNLPAVYWQIGCIDVIRSKIILNKNSMTGKHIKPLILDELFAIDIDTPQSLKIAEIFLGKYL